MWWVAGHFLRLPRLFGGFRSRFGLTPIEALASGTPVVASDIPPHREFGGHAVTYFPLDDDDALVTAVAAALDSNPPRQSFAI